MLHEGNSKFGYLRRNQTGPARLAITGHGQRDYFGAKSENRREICRLDSLGEREVDDVEIARGFPEDVENADRAAVAQRVWKIRRENRDGLARRRERPAFVNFV